MSALEALKARRQAAQAAQLAADGNAALQEGAAAASGTQAAGAATTSTSSSAADGEEVMHMHGSSCLPPPCMESDGTWRELTAAQAHALHSVPATGCLENARGGTWDRYQDFCTCHGPGRRVWCSCMTV